jgi:hypothetical protein
LNNKEGNTALHLVLESRIQEELFRRIKEAAPTAEEKDYDSLQRNIELGCGRLTVGSTARLKAIPAGAFHKSKWDVVCGAYIRVLQQEPRPNGWGSSLWYMGMSEDGSYRWYEVSYMTSFGGTPASYEPFELCEIREADLATSHVIHVYQRAFGPEPIDVEDMESFLERWLLRFAEATEGRLQRPPRLPLD